VAAAELLEAMSCRGESVLRLTAMIPAILDLLGTHQPAWAEMHAAHHSALLVLLRIVQASSEASSEARKAEAAMAHLLTPQAVEILLACMRKGRDGLETELLQRAFTEPSHPLQGQRPRQRARRHVCGTSRTRRASELSISAQWASL